MTSAPVIDERLHWTALAAAINAHEDDLPVYDYNTVPKQPPPIFALLGIERRYVDPRRAGRAGRSGWRITARYVGRTVNEARWAGLKVAEALDEQRLTIGGILSGLITHESTTAIEPDDGRFSGLAIYTYSL